MAYGYCFGCGTRVSTSDLEKGLAKRLPQGLCCRSCAKTAEEALSLAGGIPEPRLPGRRERETDSESGR